MGAFPGFNNNQIEAIKSQALRFWKDATSAQDMFFRNTNDRERMAHCKIPRELERVFDAHPDMSCLAPPDFYINIESIRAAVHNLIFNSKPYAIVSKFGNPGLRDGQVVKSEAILQHQNDVAMDDQISDDIVLQALYAGVGCCFTRWTSKAVPIPRRYPDGTIITDDQGVPIFDDQVVAEFAEMVPIDIRRVRIDPSVDCLKNRRIVGHHLVESAYKLLELNREKFHFYNFDEDKLLASSFNENDYYEYIYEEHGAYPGLGQENQGYGDKIIEVKSIRGIFRVPYGNSFLFEDCIIHLANDDIVLGLKRNDMPVRSWEMYDFATVSSELGRVFPMGVIEPAQDAWVEKFLKHNQSLDKANRLAHDMYVGDSAACQNLPSNITHENGKLIQVDMMASGAVRATDAFSVLPHNTAPDVMFEHSQVLEQSIQRIMKLSDYIQGSDPGRQETATAVEALMQGGQSLLMHLTDKLKYSFFQPVWQKKLIYFNFFRGHLENKAYDQKGQGEIRIKPNELTGQLWQIDIDTQANRDFPSRVRRFVEMFPALIQNPYFDAYELCKTAVSVLQLPNADRILRDNELQHFTIDRENLAMAGGVEQPVHENDNHEMHLQDHNEFVDSGNVPKQFMGLFQNHDQTHQMYFDQQMQGGLGNTKELGGNTGQSISPANAAIKARTRGGTGLKQEVRA